MSRQKKKTTLLGPAYIPKENLFIWQQAESPDRGSELWNLTPRQIRDLKSRLRPFASFCAAWCWWALDVRSGEALNSLIWRCIQAQGAQNIYCVREFNFGEKRPENGLRHSICFICMGLFVGAAWLCFRDQTAENKDRFFVPFPQLNSCSPALIWGQTLSSGSGNLCQTQRDLLSSKIHSLQSGVTQFPNIALCSL